MPNEYLGPFYALLTALAWAIGVVLFKKSGSVLAPIALNLLKNCVALVLIVASGWFMGVGTEHVSRSDLWMLLASGALGIGIADTLLFAGLNLTGATHQAIVETTYAPSVVVLSYFMLGERLTASQGAGGACILMAVVIAAPRSSGPSLGPNAYVRGAMLGGASMVMMAFAIVWVKPVLERNDVIFCTGVRLVGGLLTLAVMTLTTPKRRSAALAAFRPQPAWRDAIPGAFIGTYVSLLCWIAAFKYAPAGVAALLNQTSTAFTVILAARFLREPITPRVVVAVLLALSGSVIVLGGLP